MNYNLYDLWSILAFILHPISSQIARNEGDELNAATIFIVFASCRLFGVPPGSDLFDFRSILEGFWTSWGGLGASWGLLEVSSGIFEASWAILGSLGGNLEAS